jgi:hypothetical protein
VSIVIPRATWKPRYSNGATNPQGQPIIIGTTAWEAAGRELWAHHSVTNPPGPDATLEQDCAHMREFEAIGQANFGQGISYTWVIMPSGRVFEGHSIDRRGAHTYQRNDRSRAVCFAGNYDVRDLPDRMANAAALLLAEIDAEFDGGHRDVYPTACPGRYAYARLGDINRLSVAQRRGDIDLSEEDDVFDDAAADRLLNRDVTISAPGDPKYSETRKFKDWVGKPYFWDSDSYHTIQRLEAKVDALSGQLSDGEADILAAIRAAANPDVPTDYDRLGQSIAANLPAPTGGITPEQLEAELTELFGRVYRLNDTEEQN